MTLIELEKECEKAESTWTAHPEFAGIIVAVKPRKRFSRQYRICPGLYGDVVGGNATHLNIFIKCSVLRPFLKFCKDARLY